VRTAVMSARAKSRQREPHRYTRRPARAAVLACSGRPLLHGFQERLGWTEEQGPGHGAAEVKQPIIIAGRAADEHVLDHLLGHPRCAAIADEVGAELGRADAAERHVVAQDFELFPILRIRLERAVRRRRLYRVSALHPGRSCRYFCTIT